MSDPIRHRALADNLAARLRVCSIAEQWLIDRALGSLEGVRERDVFGRRWERRIATGPGDIDRSWHLVSRFDHDVRRHIATTACNGSWMRDDPTETLNSPPLEERCTACWREAVQGDALGLALIDAWGEIQAEERAKEGLREAAREEMVPRRVPDGTPGVRDPDAPCSDFDPGRAGAGRCDGDGHYLCAECRNRSSANVRDRAQPEPVVTIGLPGDDLSDRVVVDEFEVEQHLTRVSATPALELDSDPRPYEAIEVEREPDGDPADEWDVSDIPQAGPGREVRDRRWPWRVDRRGRGGRASEVAHPSAGGYTAEVTRMASSEPSARLANGHATSVCSFLYAACWRAARAMGYRKLVTYNLPGEGGQSLRGAGWICIGEAGGGSWDR